jgi:hypothetical protein
MCQKILLQRKILIFTLIHLQGFLVDSNCSMLFLVHCSLVLVPVLSMPGMDFKHFVLFGLRSYFICIGDIWNSGFHIFWGPVGFAWYVIF